MSSEFQSSGKIDGLFSALSHFQEKLDAGSSKAEIQKLSVDIKSYFQQLAGDGIEREIKGWQSIPQNKQADVDKLFQSLSQTIQTVHPPPPPRPMQGTMNPTAPFIAFLPDEFWKSLEDFQKRWAEIRKKAREREKKKAASSDTTWK